MISNDVTNGLFAFYIDDVNQNVVSDHLMSGLWIPIQRDVTAGFHVFYWMYTKYDDMDDSEDLAAEIEYIKIKGTSYSTQECQTCHLGVANFDNTRCETCLANQYFKDSGILGTFCLDCTPDKFSPPGSVGKESCRKRKACRTSDYTFQYSICNAGKNERTKEYFWKMPIICD